MSSSINNERGRPKIQEGSTAMRSSSSSPSRSPSRKSAMSPPKFGAKDFEKKKPTELSQKNAIAKARGLKVNPEDWGKKELFERISRIGGRFIEDKDTGICELIIIDRKILNDDVIVLLEVLRRFTETQKITLTNVGLNDTLFTLLFPGISGLRHLKELNLQKNMLMKETVELLIQNNKNKFSKRLEVLDLRDNNSMTFEDGKLFIMNNFYS